MLGLSWVAVGKRLHLVHHDIKKHAQTKQRPTINSDPMHLLSCSRLSDGFFAFVLLIVQNSQRNFFALLFLRSFFFTPKPPSQLAGRFSRLLNTEKHTNILCCFLFLYCKISFSLTRPLTENIWNDCRRRWLRMCGWRFQHIITRHTRVYINLRRSIEKLKLCNSFNICTLNESVDVCRSSIQVSPATTTATKKSKEFENYLAIV